MTLAMNAAGLALLARAQAGEQIPVVQFVELLTPTPQRWAVGGTGPFTWNGHSWTAREVVLGELVDEATGINDMTLVLPGVTTSEMALAFSDLEGTPAYLYDAWVDPTTGAVADAPLQFSGECDVPGWQEGAESTVLLTLVHLGNSALRPKPWLYTSEAQHAVKSADTSLDGDPATDAAPIPWPSAAYYRAQA